MFTCKIIADSGYLRAIALSANLIGVETPGCEIILGDRDCRFSIFRFEILD
ncbi:hypothetical protein [Microcoleus sp. herbarium12]|uniref:hypothetical protein n=1 Tax=Microcoleus sp. herbarium12 TaxID=3055437 RepID=UPI002FD42B30